MILILELAGAILAGAVIGMGARKARAETERVRVEMARLEAENLEAQAVANSAQAAADSAAARADSLLTELRKTEARADSRIRAIASEADTLEKALIAALDSLGASEATRANLDRILDLNASLEAEYAAVRTLSDSVITELQIRNARQRTVAESLRAALAAAEQENEMLKIAWESALNPGWMDRIFRDAKTKAGAAAVGLAVGYLIH